MRIFVEANNQTVETSALVEILPDFGLRFSNQNPITIRDGQSADPYPSIIEVQGVEGSVTRMEIRLHGFRHEYPQDVDLFLASPNESAILLMSDAGGNQPVQSVELAFAPFFPRHSHCLNRDGDDIFALGL